MQDRIYLLELSGTAKEDVAKLWKGPDAERRSGTEESPSKRKRLESAAAGLLLRYGVERALLETDLEKEKTFSKEHLTPSGLSGMAGEPLDLQYGYGPYGKPYLTNYPYFFSLSHSGDYALCALSGREVGADIQRMNAGNVIRLGERFFSEREKALLGSCKDRERQRELFYELWVCKEAYGKLTGRGIAESVCLDMSECVDREVAVFFPDKKGVRIQMIKAPKGYRAAFCSFLHPSFLLRGYSPGDCEQIASLFFQTVHAVNAGDYTKEQLAAWATGRVDLEAWNRSFLEHNTVVAAQDKTILGFGDMDATGYLDRLYVHKDYQRQGVASAICSRLEQVFWNRRKEKTEGGETEASRKIITHASITARPFFEKRGYRTLKEQQVERQGIWLTNFVMEKEL